jgi:PKD repeat protein
MTTFNRIFLFLLSVSLFGLTQCKKESNAPKACFTTSAVSLNPYTDITFSNCTDNGISYHWEFGDSTTSDSASPVHYYTATGTYPVTLTVVNAAGAVTKTSTITILPCNAGYEGPNCAVESRTKFLGSYLAAESGSASGAYNFNVAIAAQGGDITKVQISNMYDSFTNPVIASISGRNITIASQQPDGDGIVVSGSGSISGNVISITYTVTYSGQVDVVTATWSR